MNAQVLGDEATTVRREAAARKIEYNSKIVQNSEIPPNAIRGEQIPLSTAETRFKARAAEKGWVAHRPSWPDFLVETENGLIAVEVKSRTDDVSSEQAQTFDLLEGMGVPVFLWKDTRATKKSLIPWRGGSGLRKARAMIKARRAKKK